VRRHGLGIFERAAFFQIGGDAGCPEGMATNREDDPCRQSAFSDHAPGVDAA